MRLYSSAVIRTNFTVSPALKRLGGCSSGLKRRSGVLPISCQPPGVDIGYTPVCIPAIPTEPAGMDGLGDAFLGALIRSDIPPKNGNPGANPSI